MTHEHIGNTLSLATIAIPLAIATCNIYESIASDCLTYASYGLCYIKTVTNQYSPLTSIDNGVLYTNVRSPEDPWSNIDCKSTRSGRKLYFTSQARLCAFIKCNLYFSHVRSDWANRYNRPYKKFWHTYKKKLILFYMDIKGNMKILITRETHSKKIKWLFEKQFAWEHSQYPSFQED